MSVTQYIGARYQPIFAEPDQWTSGRAYEPLTIVLHEGNSFTSKQAVPIGIDILNTEFWACTGNYNAQVEAYRREVQQFAGDIEAAQTTANEAKEAVELETTARETADADLQTAIDDEVAERETAISNEIEAREAADEDLQTAISRLTTSAKLNDFSLAIKDRFLVNQPNTTSNVGAQTSAVFTQNNVAYCAYIVKDDGVNNDNCNKLVVRNLSTNSQIGELQYNFEHGAPLSFNAENNLLVTTLAESNEAVFIDVQNPTNPVISRTVSYTPALNLGSALCWYNDNLLHYNNTSKIVSIWNDSLTELIEEFSLEYQTDMQPYTYQAQCIYGSILVVAVSNPEGLIIYDLEAKKQIGTLNMPQHIGHVRIGEVEGVSITETSIFVSAVSYIDGFSVNTLFEYNYITGILEQDDTFRLRNQKYVTLNVDYANGSLINPVDNNYTFKLVGDALTYIKNVFNDEAMPTISFQGDFPTEIFLTAFNGNVYFNNHTFVKATFQNCKLTVVNSQDANFTTTGDAITFANGCVVSLQSAFSKSNNAPNCAAMLRALDSYVITNQTQNDVNFTRTIFSALVKPVNGNYGSCAFLQLANSI